MAITSLDGLLVGFRPQYFFAKAGATMEAIGQRHLHYAASGIPGPWTPPTPGLAGATLVAPVSGAFLYTNPGAGLKYLTKFQVASTLTATYVLQDLLWSNSGIVVTTLTAQTINSVTLPARDADGATAGAGVSAALLITTTTTNAGVVTVTISYTNSVGTAGRTATTIVPATALQGTLCVFNLQSGDLGVRSIQTITIGTSLVTGAVSLVLMRDIAMATCSLANTSIAEDPISLGMPQTYDGSVLFLAQIPTAVTATTLYGSIGFAEG
jgi:hypothetical protein